MNLYGGFAMDENLKIDDVARQSGLSKRTIRYYEEIGLLESPPRSSGGTRIYAQKHVEFLKKVTTLKEVLGFSLQELQHFISLRDTFERERKIYQQEKNPRSRKEKLEEICHSLNDQIQVIEEKTKKILSVKSELISMRDRAQARIEELNKELKNDNIVE